MMHDESNSTADLLSAAESPHEVIAALRQQLDELREELKERRQAEDELRASVARHAQMEQRLEALVQASSTLTETLEPAHVLASILEFSQRLIPADAYAIWRWHAGTRHWEIAAHSGLSPDYRTASVDMREQGAGMPDVPVVADDVFSLPLLADRKQAYVAEGIRSLLAVPLRMHGQVCGTLVFYHRQPYQFGETEVTLATAVANLSAAAIASADSYGEQTQLYSQVQASEERFARFMQQLPGLAWIKDSQGRYVYANDAAVAAFCSTREQLYGRSDEEVFPPLTAAQFKENDQRALARASGVQVVECLEHADGVLHYSVVSKFPIPGREGQPALVGGMAIDITDRKRTEDDARFLASASAALAALVDYKSTLQTVARLAVPSFADWCTVDVLDADGKLERLAVAHVDPSKVELAHELHRRYPPDPASPGGVWKIIRSGKSSLTREITDEMLARNAKDPEFLHIMRDLGLKSYMGVPLKLRDKVLGVISFISAESRRSYDHDDLTVAEDLAHRAAVAVDNARLYQALKEADRRKDEFLALLGHELRNPLAPLCNSLQLLKLPDVDASIAARARDMMERQLEHLVRLVDDLLDVSRIMRGRIELRREPVDLSAVIARAVETSQPLLDAEGHRLTVAVDPQPLRVDGDLVRLAQVVSNLLNNAARYTPRGGQIWLSAARDGDQAVIRVRDNGVGIAPETLPRLFDMFYQAERAGGGSRGGLGIGLSLVRGLAELHGGSAEARSAGVGTGSEFVVRLPLLPIDRDRPRQTAGHEARQMPPRRRVLVVDDNRDAADSLAMLLRNVGQEVEVAYDGTSAVAKAEAERPEIVLLDLGMPQMDGFQVAAAFRASPQLADVVLVALTGWGQPEDRQKTKQSGFDQHLVKPVDLDALRRLLECSCR